MTDYTSEAFTNLQNVDPSYAPAARVALEAFMSTCTVSCIGGVPSAAHAQQGLSALEMQIATVVGSA
jgi:hypothetical protein